jgi:hypothetical protein
MAAFILSGCDNDALVPGGLGPRAGQPRHAALLGGLLKFADPSHGSIDFEYNYVAPELRHESFFDAMLCLRCSAIIPAFEVCFTYEAMRTVFTICHGCVSRKAKECGLRMVRREKASVEASDHPSADRIAELNLQIEDVISELNS